MKTRWYRLGPLGGWTLQGTLIRTVCWVKSKIWGKITKKRSGGGKIIGGSVFQIDTPV